MGGNCILLNILVCNKTNNKSTSNFLVIFNNSYIRFGPVPANFAMDNVRCQGNERHIIECPHVEKDDCGSSEGAGVQCTGKYRTF